MTKMPPSQIHFKNGTQTWDSNNLGEDKVRF